MRSVGSCAACTTISIGVCPFTRLCSMCAHGLLPSDGSSRSRAVRRADHAAGASAYAEQRPRHAEPRGCVRDDAGGGERRACGRSACDAAAPMRRPCLRHRRVVCAELVALFCDLARRSPAPIGVRPSAWLWAAWRYPSFSVMRSSAPPTSSSAATPMQPLTAARCSAVHLRTGRARLHRRHHRPPPTTAQDSNAKGAPAAVLGVHVGAGAEQRCDDRAIAIGRRNHQRRHSIPAHGGADRGGEPRPIRGTLARVLPAHSRPKVYAGSPGGSAPQNPILKLRSG
jgi:hypothetical protein